MTMLTARCHKRTAPTKGDRTSGRVMVKRTDYHDEDTVSGLSRSLQEDAF